MPRVLHRHERNIIMRNIIVGIPIVIANTIIAIASPILTFLMQKELPLSSAQQLLAQSLLVRRVSRHMLLFVQIVIEHLINWLALSTQMLQDEPLGFVVVTQALEHKLMSRTQTKQA